MTAASIARSTHPRRCPGGTWVGKPKVSTLPGVASDRHHFHSGEASAATVRPRSPKELITRLLSGRCELCGRSGKVQVHHIRKLADLDKLGQPERPAWAAIMAKRRRKSLVVCHHCHDEIHGGQQVAKITE
jgi:AI2M/AI1M-like, HNH endonuclease